MMSSAAVDSLGQIFHSGGGELSPEQFDRSPQDLTGTLLIPQFVQERFAKNKMIGAAGQSFHEPERLRVAKVTSSVGPMDAECSLVDDRMSGRALPGRRDRRKEASDCGSAAMMPGTSPLDDAGSRLFDQQDGLSEVRRRTGKPFGGRGAIENRHGI